MIGRSQGAAQGSRWPVFLSELIDTALRVLVGLSWVIVMFGAGTPMARLLPSEGLRRLVTGFLFGTTGASIVLGEAITTFAMVTLLCVFLGFRKIRPFTPAIFPPLSRFKTAWTGRLRPGGRPSRINLTLKFAQRGGVVGYRRSIFFGPYDLWTRTPTARMTRASMSSTCCGARLGVSASARPSRTTRVDVGLLTIARPLARATPSASARKAG